jgi:hypothetical protein
VFTDKTDNRRDHSLSKDESAKMMETGNFKGKLEEEPDSDPGMDQRLHSRKLLALEEDDVDSPDEHKTKPELMLFQRQLRLAAKPKHQKPQEIVRNAWKHMEHRVTSQGRTLELASLRDVKAALDSTERKLKFLEKSYADFPLVTLPTKKDFTHWRNLSLAEDFEWIVNTSDKIKKDVTDVINDGGFKDILYQAEKVGKMVAEEVYPAAEEMRGRVVGVGILLAIGLALFCN